MENKSHIKLSDRQNASKWWMKYMIFRLCFIELSSEYYTSEDFTSGTPLRDVISNRYWYLTFEWIDTKWNVSFHFVSILQGCKSEIIGHINLQMNYFILKFCINFTNMSFYWDWSTICASFSCHVQPPWNYRFNIIDIFYTFIQ